MPNRAVDVNSRARSACYPRSTFCPLSYGPSTQNHRITRSDFRPCSRCLSHSQASLYPCTQRTVTVRAELTFERLRYRLGGDRPSQTARLPLFSGSIQSAELESRQNKGGISPATPPGLAPRLHSLPPMLHMPGQDPMARCSKGSRGLFVRSRAGGIFTATTVSPGILPRQRSTRYTIRAGRNLPDKEFRYLRTVRVTAAVYRGFGRDLRPPCGGLSLFLNLPAPGRCQSLYVALRLSRDMCFC